MNDGPGDEETRLLRVALARQRQIIESKKKDMAVLEQKIKETLRRQDEVFLKLFPPVRPDRNASYISSLIEEKGVELMRLQDAIKAQETKIDAPEPSDSGIGEGSLSQLKRQYATTHANVEHLRSLLSPIRVLPVELLAEIFMLSYDPMGRASLSNAALVVSHVCSSWRNIAIHKPHLWSSLKFGPDNFATKPHGIIPMARMWLERSGNRPLRLFVRPDDKPKDSPDPAPYDLFVQLIRLYVPHLARWKDVFFDFARFTGSQELFSDIPKDASLHCLENFGIILGNITYADWVEFPRLLNGAPRLKRLTWITKSFIHDPPFKFGELTQLVVGGHHSLTRALSLLYHGKRLRVIDFIVFITSSYAAGESSHIVNESLQGLILSCAGDSSVFFDSLTLPALQDLHVTKTYSLGTHAPSTWSRDSFLQFLCRSKCHLTSLGIVDYDMTPDDVLALLRHLSPSLVKFEIESFQARFITDGVLNAMTYPPENSLVPVSAEADNSPSILCPLLRELRIVGCLSSTDGVLAKMVESRCRPPPGLVRLGTGFFSLDSFKLPQDRARILALNGRKTDYVILEEAP